MLRGEEAADQVGHEKRTEAIMDRLCVIAFLALTLPGACSAQQPLRVTRTEGALTATGDHFSATWHADRGWQISALEIADYAGSWRLDGERDNIGGIGAIALRCDGATYRASLGEAGAPELVEQTADRLVFDVRVRPRAADGTPCPLVLTERFTVLGEGGIFCDFAVEAPAGIGAVTLDEIEVGMALATAPLQHLRWHFKHTWQGAEDRAREATLDDPRYLRTMGATLGRERPYTNQVEMCLEERKPLVGEGDAGFRCEVTGDEGGAKRFSWHIGGPMQAGAGTVYSNRWGLALGHQRRADNAVGQRIAHWQEGNASLMTYPSDTALDAMAECGVSLNVLHLYWYGRPAYTPFDEAEMRRWIASSHARGIRCAVYATPCDREGISGINPEWVQGLGLDGIYFDFGSVHTMSGRADADGRYQRAFPALATVELTRRFRAAVGPDGIIISHSGGYAPDTFFHLNLNAYLPGEASVQTSMLRDVRAAAYHSGMAYAVVHPWCEYADFQTRHGAATYAAMGGFPHILFGRGTHQDNNYHRSVYRSAEFALPYWQILSTIPMDAGTQLFTWATERAAWTDQPGVSCCVYRRSADLLLVTASNLGEACAPTLELDRELLGLSGSYRVIRLSGLEIARFAATEIGAWSGGSIELGRLETDDYLGLLLIRGETPEHTARELARIERLVAAFNDPQAPTVPTGLTATASPGAVELSWQPADDEHHVVEYRLYRAADGGELQPLVAIEEETAYADYTAPMGREVSYALSAVDVAGNESGRSEPVRVRTPGRALEGEATAASGRWERERSLATSAGWLRQGIDRVPATAAGDTIEFAPTTAQWVRAHFTGGQGNYGSAHVIEMAVHDEAGNTIPPAAITSIGSDPGHPDTQAADGSTDQTRNGWWSDRTRSMPVWIAFDLGQPRRIADVWLLTYWDDRRFYDYTIQLSEDGQEWRDVGSGLAPTLLARALGDAQLADGTVGVTTLEIDPERAGGGLLFRCPDENNGYALTLEPRWDGNLVLDKLVDGKLQRLAGAFFPFSIHNPIPHRLAVECAGPVIRCYGDGRLVMEVTDETSASGRVGMIVPSGRRLKFMNLSAEPGQQ
ncbi:MAG TPA: discoidin domain-containing protein [Armatimonadota bacterium]|nr:discoidin domain-containing protein [Armatimonadota bacterium]